MNEPSAEPLLRNLVLFSRLLRDAGVHVTPGGTVELASALAVVDLGRRDDVYNASRAVLINRHGDLAPFDRAFALFWRVWTSDMQGRSDEQSRSMHPEPAPLPLPSSKQPAEDSMRTGDGQGEDTVEPLTEAVDDGEEGEGRAALLTWSRDEQFHAKDFALMNDEDLLAARRFLDGLHWELTRRRSRRMRPSQTGHRPDFRRTIRRSLGTGGELFELAWRGPKMKRRGLVVLCDISGSMDRYSRLFLHFVHALERNLHTVEVFVFGTRLTRITRDLEHRNPDLALAQVASGVLDWSGGTRIGESLAAFNRDWSRRVLDRGAIVLLISDGWDRGDPALLQEQMARLQRAAYRLIWLNPLLGAAGYEPLTRGLQAALPFVDDFLPIHNLRSLEELATLLNGIGENRPARGTQRIAVP
jgi:uncharacterized protein with von Willebrand factor type A (vWA) domain